jgi:hypothetical protein
MNIKLAFLLPKLLLLTKSAILVFLLSMMQPQHGFSSIEGEETEKNNPPGFNPIQKFDSDGNFITSWGSEGDGDGVIETEGIDSGLVIVVAVVVVLVLLSSLIGDVKIWPSIKYSLTTYDYLNKGEEK